MARKKSLFEKNATAPFKLSRSKIESFLKCKRCFYLDRKVGISPPPTFPFTLNNAVDALFKKEFDIYRAQQKPHPIIKNASVDAVPLISTQLEKWQDYHNGLQYFMSDLNMIVYGAPDDVWVNSNGEYIVVDYKATSSDKEITLNDEWKKAYKHQVEIYQWLLRKNGFKVSNTAYFVYANALKDKASFNNTLTFDTTLLPYVGDCNWVENTIREAYSCLCSEHLPAADSNCDACKYAEAVMNYKGNK